MRLPLLCAWLVLGSAACEGEESGGGAGAAGGGPGPSVGGAGGLGGSGGEGLFGGGGGPLFSPALGTHSLVYYRHQEDFTPSISTPELLTTTGSTLIVGTGRGDVSAVMAPTDNLGNTGWMQLGASHTYTNWPSSGTAVHALSNVTGGPGHVITTANAPGDEITMMVVEVLNSSTVVDQQWVERLSTGGAVTSLPVETTGAALLIAFWWGDAGVDQDKVATPNNEFVVIDSIGLSGSLVQGFVAAKAVPSGGTYDVSWDATPAQGAQLWLVAVQ